jgi:hydroxymethylglutaryl-CoA reductase
MPLAVGIVGGATRVHPTARMALDIMGITTADRLARVAGAVGLVQNFSALKALATEGIQRGHMSLHAKNVAIAAGAHGSEIAAVARELVARKAVRVEVAEEVLSGLRVAPKS